MKAKVPLWVVKIGSQQIIDGGPLLIRSLMKEVSQLIQAKKINIVWVSSGAIATSRQRLNLQWHSLQEKQALSAIGQPLLMELYNTALLSQGLMGAQVLLSYNDFKRKESRTNLRNTIMQLIDWNIIPILNENDTVATDEIQFGDNDQLSAKVACELNADRLVILTHIGGVYNKNPTQPNAQLIPFIPKLSLSMIEKIAPADKSALGRGGMQSKLIAAHRAWSKKIPTSIVDGECKNVLTQMQLGKSLGTSIGSCLIETRKKTSKR